MDWQLIETAPKEARRLMLYRPLRKETVFGYWDADKYAAKPKPFWHTDNTRLWGMRDARADAPSHWANLPTPP